MLQAFLVLTTQHGVKKANLIDLGITSGMAYWNKLRAEGRRQDPRKSQ